MSCAFTKFQQIPDDLDLLSSKPFELFALTGLIFFGKFH